MMTVCDEDDDNRDDINLHHNGDDFVFDEGGEESDLHLSGHLYQNGNDLVVDVGDEESDVHLGGHDAPLVLPLVDDPRAGARAQTG